MELVEFEEKYIENPNKENRKRLIKKLKTSEIFVRFDENDNPVLLTDEDTGEVLICLDSEPFDEHSKPFTFKECIRLKDAVSEVLETKAILVLDIDSFEIDIPEDIL